MKIVINLISAEDKDDERKIPQKRDNTEIMINNKAIYITEKIFFDEFLIYIKLDWEHQREVVTLSLIVFIYCIINAIK